MKGYKTLAASALITIIGSLQQIGVINLVPEHFQGVAIAAIGLVMAGLRLVTNTPALNNR